MDLLTDFIQDCRDRGMTPGTLNSYRWNIKRYLTYLGGKDPIKVDRQDLKGYVDALRQRGVTKKTAGLYFAALKTFYDYLIYEGIVEINPIDPVRKRYLSSYKLDSQGHTHQILSIEEAAALIDAMVDIRDKALVTLLFKTGVRRKELTAMDVEDINWKNQSILLKPTPKRTNRIVFFDDEAEALLKRWIAAREHRAKPEDKALFIGLRGRLRQGGIYKILVDAGRRVGLHNDDSPNMEDHVSPHICRHWFTTHLRRSGMPREFIQELRGDVRRDAIDIYDHIDKDELRESYLEHIPKLGI